MRINGSVKEHLGTVLDNNYFQPRKLSIYRVAKETGISKKALCGVLCGRLPLPVKEAMVLARYFGEKEDFFANMQLQYELTFEKQQLSN